MAETREKITFLVSKEQKENLYNISIYLTIKE